MTEKIREDLLKIRNSGRTNMFDVKKVFEIAVSEGYNELADYIFSHTSEYCNFILTGETSSNDAPATLP